MRRRRERSVWGSTGGDRRPSPLLMVGVGIGVLAAFAGLGALMAALLRSGAASSSPLAVALGLGCMMVLFLAGAVGALLAVARRFAQGSAARRAVIIGGLGVLMGLAPALMMFVVYLLSRGA